MDIALIVLGFFLLMPALAGAFSLGLHLLAPNWSHARRISWSTASAALLPMSLPLGGFLFESPSMIANEGMDTFWMGLLALVVTMIVCGAVFCLPTAWFVTSRLDRGGKGGADIQLPDRSETPAMIGTDG